MLKLGRFRSYTLHRKIPPADEITIAIPVCASFQTKHILSEELPSVLTRFVTSEHLAGIAQLAIYKMGGVSDS